ncbi:MAG: HAD family phosphatase [Propionibacteriales bacterium]|nr:HAD family phosphatase [Propionibacteriales bacterium]
MAAAEPVVTAVLGRPAAIAFDCDGLLVETESSWTIAESAVFARHGLDYTEELKRQLIGTSIDFTVAAMATWFGRPGSEAELKAELTATVADVIAARAEPMPGAVELVGDLAGRLPLAVVSNSARHLVDLALGCAGLIDVLPVIVAAEDVLHGKPAPDLYVRACALLGVRPSQAVAFEDSLVGVDAAKAAGLRVVGVPTMPQVGFEPDLVVSSLADPAIVDWARQL